MARAAAILLECDLAGAGAQMIAPARGREVANEANPADFAAAGGAIYDPVVSPLRVGDRLFRCLTPSEARSNCLLAGLCRALAGFSAGWHIPCIMPKSGMNCAI